MGKHGNGDSGHLPPFISPVQDWREGQPLEFADFVPLRDGSGARVIVDRFKVWLVGTITVADANFDGRDVCRMFSNIEVEQRSGRKRWALSGYKSRIKSIKYNGIRRHNEHATIAIGAGAAVEFELCIPMAKRKVFRPKDFSLAADVFKRITVTCNSLANAATGATTLSAADLEVFITAEWHPEYSVEIKSEDVVKSINFTSTTQVVGKFTGALHDVDFVREPAGGGTAGGDVVTGITAARSDELGIPSIPFRVLKNLFREQNELGNTASSAIAAELYKHPYVDGTALALVSSTSETSVDDGKVIETIKFDVDGGAAGLALVTREVVAKSQADLATQTALFKIKSLRMKTAGKTKRSFGHWADNERAQATMPWSAPLPPAA